jgi:hypothetical protein
LTKLYKTKITTKLHTYSNVNIGKRAETFEWDKEGM